MRMKVGVSRKEATDRDGSVGATCEMEIEIPGNATDEEVRHIRDRWLEMCEDTVDEELDRLRHAASRSGPASPPASATRRDAAPPPRPSRPEYGTPPAPTRARRPDDDEGDNVEERRAPTDGRQLLGWAAKQMPDAKGLVISFGKKKGYPPKIVDWDDEQVRAAYHYARGHKGR